MNQQLITIKQVVATPPYLLTIKFGTGEVLEADLEKELNELRSEKDTQVAQLDDFKYFESFKIDNNTTALIWDNGLSFGARKLYEMGKERKRNDDRQRIMFCGRT